MPMAPLTPAGPTPLTPVGPAIAGAGRFADRWQQRTKGGQGVTAARPLTEEEKKAQRLLHSKRKYALSTALDKTQLDEAVEAAGELLEQGQSIPHDLLYRLICTAADSPGVERFARVVNICTRADLRFDVMEWASLVGRLMARDAPHAQVRVCLNFGLPKDGQVMELIPPDANRQSDIEKCFAGAEHLDIGELSDEEDIATVLHASSASGLRPPPKALNFSGCSWKKLNGTYTKCRKKDWESALSKKPVYKKMDGLGDKFPTYVYHYEFDATKQKKKKAEEEEEEAWKSGWYIGTEVGGGGATYAYCSEEASEIPPTFATWQIIHNSGQKEEFLGFERVDRGSVQSAKVVEWEEAQEHLKMVELDRLPGRVTGEDPEVTKYFNHFFILLHLEQLAEVAGFRGRFGFRRADELASFGIALIDTELEDTWGYTDESRRMSLPGWPELGQEKVSFKMPRVMNIERFGIKRGESVLISRGDPLKSRVTEGSVIEAELRTRQLIVNVNGKFPRFDGSARFRIDCYANRTTFERQLTALLQFITMKRTKMQEMLIAAGVGRVDLAVLGGDGFIDPSEGTKLAERKKKDEEVEARKKKRREGATQAKVVVSDEALEQPDDGQDFGGDGTWVDAEVNEVEEEVEEVEVDESEEDEAPRTAEDVIAKRLARELEETREDRAKRLAKELEEDLGDHFPEAKPLQAKPSVAATSQNTAGIKESKEEQIKRNTLALANEDAEGIDKERLEAATEMVQTLPDLSAAQRNALTNSLSKRLTIVQGPPGTGKTHTSVRILTMWAKQMRYSPLLATSECNIAVDNIAEGLAKAGVKVVRIGRPEKVREVLEPVCLDNMVKADRIERAREREEEESDIEELGEEPWDEKSPEHKEWEELRQKWRRKMAWERKQDAFARARFVEAAEVLCATTVTAGSQALSGYKFRAILIDEVAQATETSAIVPIVCRGAQQIALCGDHCQLPPSTVSREAEMRGMSLSLYSRLVEAGVPFQFLDTQYRAHPALMEFSASCIYQGRLKNGIDGSQRPVPKGIPWPNPENPAAFFPSENAEGLNGESKDNRGEADMVVNLVCEVLKHKEITLNDIGIVTPYKGQVRTLRDKLFKKFPEAKESRELEIASVDNFQGREKELIIFSAVRCNDECKVGFLNDWRRLNVMITRARRGLVVIGNAATLACDKHWRMWLQFTEKQGGCRQGTVENAIKDAHAKLDLLGRPNYKRRIFPQTLNDMLSSTPGVGEAVKKAKEKARLAKLKKKEKKQDDGRDRDLDYLDEAFEEDVEVDEEEEEQWEEQDAGKKEIRTWGDLMNARDAKVCPKGKVPGSKTACCSSNAATTPAEASRPSSKRKVEAKADEEAWEEEWDEEWGEETEAVKTEAKKAKAVGGEVGGKKPTTKAKPSSAAQPADSWEGEWDGEEWEAKAAPAKPAAKAKTALQVKEDEWEDEAWEEPCEAKPTAKAKDVVKARVTAKVPQAPSKPTKAKVAQAEEPMDAEDAEWNDAEWEAWEEPEQEQVAQPAKKKARPSAAPSKFVEEAGDAEVEVEVSSDLWGLLGGKAPRSRGSRV